jgi:hypothetical protein
MSPDPPVRSAAKDASYVRTICSDVSIGAAREIGSYVRALFVDQSVSTGDPQVGQRNGRRFAIERRIEVMIGGNVTRGISRVASTSP